MPKWENRGHEFDCIGNIFIQNSDILIIGSKAASEKLKERLKFLNTNVQIKTDIPEYIEKKAFLSFLHEIIFRVDLKKYLKTFPNNCTILIAKQGCDNKALKWLKRLGKKHFGHNRVFGEEEFFRKYLSIYAVYVKNLVYFRDTSFICTTVCNLNCKSCLNFNPYIKKKEHNDINKLKASVDSYFKCIDMVGRFHISGGEPQLYPNLTELISYIHDNYSSKIEALTMVTNGTYIPTDELCETLKRCNVTVETDDYRANVPKLRDTYPKVVEKLRSYGIKIDEFVAGELWDWFELFPPKDIIKKDDVKKAVNRYTKCDNPFMGLVDGKLNNCCYAGFAQTAGIIKQTEDEFYDLESFTPDKKKELVEFRLRYNEKGYAEFCRFCNGFPSINPNRVKPALQADSLLEWDINTPAKNICKKHK